MTIVPHNCHHLQEYCLYLHPCCQVMLHMFQSLAEGNPLEDHLDRGDSLRPLQRTKYEAQKSWNELPKYWGWGLGGTRRGM